MKQFSRNQLTRDNLSGMTRRQFVGFIGGLTALGLVDPLIAAQVLDPDKKRLSWLANRTAGSEGFFKLTEVEGKVPAELHGTLYRVGPGQKENHGVQLKHLFDGDAFIKAYSIRDGQVSLRAQFVATPERLEEIQAGRMIYGEFGTLAPKADPASANADASKVGRIRMKNQPSVNVISWDERLLGLSEGGHPSAIDPATLAFQEYWDFHGTLPANVPMTAHPKFDPVTGEGYMYGMRQGFPAAVLVFRMEKDGRLKQLHEVKTQSYYMIHDMILTKNYILFVIPPVSFNPMDVMTGKLALGDALKFFEDQPLRIMILRRDGTGAPVTIEQPPSVVFHNGNGFERDGKIVIDSMLAADGSVLKTIDSWGDDKLPQPAQPVFTRLVLNPEAGKIESRTQIKPDQEFPRFDSRRLGTEIRFLYTVETGTGDDPFAFTHLLRHDLQTQKSTRVDSGSNRAYGEPVFVPHPEKEGEEEGWLFVEGYDATRDECYLEIKDAPTMEMQARVWTGRHMPLGFHGNFVPNSFITA